MRTAWAGAVVLSALFGLAALLVRPGDEGVAVARGAKAAPVDTSPAARPEPTAPARRPLPSSLPARQGASDARYPWLERADADRPSPAGGLEQRFPPPEGHARVPVAAGSFGAFLRTLPLAAPGTPVVSYTGQVLRAGDHPNVAAVMALDVGGRDLQQCADTILRMHAEWQWARGERDQGYRAASGLPLSFARYAGGERLRVEDGKPRLVLAARPAPPTHAMMRAWLDDVFGWANTGSLARDAQRVAIEDLRPGDFFVMPGSPFGHAVLVLDIAKDAAGRRALLVGQGFVPAQSFHVVRPSPAQTWFVLDEAAGALATPFWRPFPFSTLRRLDG